MPDQITSHAWSTAITDLVRDWGPKEGGGLGLVEIAEKPAAFAAALQAVPTRSRGPWLKQVDRRLAQLSWDRTWAEMRGLIETALRTTAQKSADETLALVKAAGRV